MQHVSTVPGRSANGEIGAIELVSTLPMKVLVPGAMAPVQQHLAIQHRIGIDDQLDMLRSNLPYCPCSGLMHHIGCDGSSSSLFGCRSHVLGLVRVSG